MSLCPCVRECVPICACVCVCVCVLRVQARQGDLALYTDVALDNRMRLRASVNLQAAVQQVS
jgi:hypothetical protein